MCTVRDPSTVLKQSSILRNTALLCHFGHSLRRESLTRRERSIDACVVKIQMKAFYVLALFCHVNYFTIFRTCPISKRYHRRFKFFPTLNNFLLIFYIRLLSTILSRNQYILCLQNMKRNSAWN